MPSAKDTIQLGGQIQEAMFSGLRATLTEQARSQLATDELGVRVFGQMAEIEQAKQQLAEQKVYHKAHIAISERNASVNERQEERLDENQRIQGRIKFWDAFGQNGDKLWEGELLDSKARLERNSKQQIATQNAIKTLVAKKGDGPTADPLRALAALEAGQDPKSLIEPFPVFHLRDSHTSTL